LKRHGDRRSGTKDSRKKVINEPFNIQFPENIRLRLLNDQIIVSKQHLSEVPRPQSAKSIIRDFSRFYFEMMELIDSYSADVRAEIFFGQRFAFEPFMAQQVIDDLQFYMNETFPNLLFPFEKTQYKYALRLRVPPADSYGVEHLLRFIALIPGFAQKANLSEEVYYHLRHVVFSLVEFISKRMDQYPTSYDKATQEYIDNTNRT